MISLGIEVVNSSKIMEPLVPRVAMGPETVTWGHPVLLTSC